MLKGNFQKNKKNKIVPTIPVSPSRNFIFRVSIIFDGFDSRKLEIMERFFNSAIDDTIGDLQQDFPLISSMVEYDVLLDVGISLYISHIGEEKWNSDVLETVVCEYYISLFISMMIILLPSNNADIINNDLGLSVYQYMKSIRVTSEVNKELLLSKTVDQSDALYVSDWVLNSLPLYSNLTISDEDMEEEITDEVMFTTQKVKEYIEEDKNNRILYTPVFRDGEIVKRSWSVLQKDFLEDKEIMEGSKRYGCYVLDTMRPQNIDRENTLVDLQAFGSYNMWVRLENIEEMLLETDMVRPSSHPAFAVIPSFRKYASLVNVDVQDSGASAVSRYHCQDTGRKVIKVHNIVPTYAEVPIKRLQCVTTDKTFRMIDETCKPGLKKDDDENCCKTSHQDLLEQLVLLSAYRNVDFPPRLNYLKEILSWYSTVRPIPSPWDKDITLSVAKQLPSDNEGLIDVINTLKPTIMNAIIAVHEQDDDDSYIGNLLGRIIKSLDVPNMFQLHIRFIPKTNEKKISDAIFEEVLKNGRYPMGYFQALMSWDESRKDQIFTICKTVFTKERFQMKLHFISKFKRDTDTSLTLEEEDIEADSVMDTIQEKIEESLRKSGFKKKLTEKTDDDDELEPYRKEHVDIEVLSFWRNKRKKERVFELNFLCKSKMSSPKKFSR